MRTYLTMAVAAAALLSAPLAGASASSADGLNRWVRINNNSGYLTVITLHAVPSRYGARVVASPDLIPSTTIRPGQSLRFNFDDGRGTCMYDLRATSQAGREWVVRNFDVCSRSEWNLGN